MDYFWIPTIIVSVVMVIMFICICACVTLAKRRRAQGTVYSTPVVVTSATHETVVTGSQGPPYPMQTGQIAHPYPVTVNYTPGPVPGPYPNQTAPYPMGYPPQGAYPMPQNQPPVIGFMAVPPPYTEVAPTNNAPREKESYPQQSPYNPNY